MLCVRRVRPHQEDKVLLLAECVPMHSGTEDEKAALTGMVEVVPRVIDVIKGVCPEMTAGDQQLLGKGPSGSGQA